MIKTDSGKDVKVRIIPKPDGKLKIKGINEKYYQESTVDEFFAEKVKATTSTHPALKKLIVFVSVLFPITWLPLIVALVERSRRKKLEKLLSLENS